MRWAEHIAILRDEYIRGNREKTRMKEASGESYVWEIG
jgi:hypothetical protein